MKKNNLIWIIICNILGALLLGSWLASTPTAGYHGPWLALDQSVFYFFNQKLAQGTAFTYFIAFVNLRAFDVVAFVAMRLCGGWRFFTAITDAMLQALDFFIGVAMLVSAVIKAV